MRRRNNEVLRSNLEDILGMKLKSDVANAIRSSRMILFTDGNKTTGTLTGTI
jgi:hypothetical protein